MAYTASNRSPWSATFAPLVFVAICMSLVILVDRQIHCQLATLYTVEARKHTPRRQTTNIAIVMSDSRRLAEVESYHHWSFLANLRYAAFHNYELRYYHIIDNPSDVNDMKNKPACHHPTHGWRASPWCKLVALLHALEQGKKRY